VITGIKGQPKRLTTKQSNLNSYCTCPNDYQFSSKCENARHRNLAREINHIFPTAATSGTGRRRRPRGVNKGSYRMRDWKAMGTRFENWMLDVFDSKAIDKWLLSIILGLVLIMTGAQINIKVRDNQKAQRFNDAQQTAAEYKEKNRTLSTQVNILKTTNAELLGEGDKVPYLAGASK